MASLEGEKAGEAEYVPEKPWANQNKPAVAYFAGTIPEWDFKRLFSLCSILFCDYPVIGRHHPSECGTGQNDDVKMLGVSGRRF